MMNINHPLSDPEAELIQIRDRDAPICHPPYQMLPELCGKICPLFEPGHLSFEDHSPEFLPEAFDVLRIISGSKAFGEFKECLLLLLFCFETLFNQFNEHPVGTQPSVFRHAPDLRGYLCREGDALTNSLFFGCHDTIMHQQWCCVTLDVTRTQPLSLL